MMRLMDAIEFYNCKKRIVWTKNYNNYVELNFTAHMVFVLHFILLQTFIESFFLKLLKLFFSG